MTTATLVLYLVIAGKMQPMRIPQPDMATCQAELAKVNAGPPPGTFQLKHVECKERKAKALPKALT